MKPIITMKEWLSLHPYTTINAFDSYFMRIAIKMYKAHYSLGKDLPMAIAGYLEDVISGMGLWSNMIRLHGQHYGRALPFYQKSNNYDPAGVNLEDVKIIVWLYLQAQQPERYLSPALTKVETIAKQLYEMVEEEYDYAPLNTSLERFYESAPTPDTEDAITEWVWRGNYMNRYTEKIFGKDYFTENPECAYTGPLALNRSEWMQTIVKNKKMWKSIGGQKQSIIIPPDVLAKNHTNYTRFMETTGGEEIMFVESYDNLRRFFVEKLRWEDNDDATLGFLRGTTRNFVLMGNRKYGIMLARDIAEAIDHKDNPMFDPIKAKEMGAEMLIGNKKGFCPPDLLRKCINEELLHYPDETTRINADFIARSMRGLYYRGE